MIRPLAIVALVALARPGPALAGDWRIEPDIGDRFRVLDPDRRTTYTVEPGIGDRLNVKDRSGRRVFTIEPGIGDRLYIIDQTGRRVGSVEQR